MPANLPKIQTPRLTPEQIEKAITAYKKRKAAQVDARASSNQKQRMRDLRKTERNKQKNPCELMLTGNPSRGRPFVVRCYCMSGYKFSKTYKRFESIGIAKTREEAQEIWEKHVNDVKNSTAAE